MHQPNSIKHKTYFNWSSGKDSALALHYLLKDPAFSVEYLLTSVNAHHQRVSMHGVRTELLEQQTASTGIRSGLLELPEQTDNSTYESAVFDVVSKLKAEEFTHAAFGDIFLEDLRAYREQQLAKLNIDAVFPLWKRDTKELMREFINMGFKTIVVCVDASLLDRSFAGRIIDEQFINDLPEGVDPCGENGEFHTFCYDGPVFNKPIIFSKGETVYREYETGEKKYGYWFCDLIP